MAWVRNPDVGGVKIPERVQERLRQRILKYAEQHYSGKYIRMEIRFRAQFCYIDAYTEPHVTDDFPPPGCTGTREEHLERIRNTPVHLGRLRYFGNEDSWSYAFYKYSDMKYELCVLDNGSFFGTPEEAVQAGAVYLQS